MNSTKRLGIWMDHSIAHLIEFTNDSMVTKTIESESKGQEKEQNSNMDESQKLSKDQSYHSAFYKKLSNVIKNFEEVVLFGPTSAKNELFNLLKGNHLFEKIKIDVKSADKMTENQQHAFVEEYFKTTHN
jgi:stalled ribosome rescue protein Dom34